MVYRAQNSVEHKICRSQPLPSHPAHFRAVNTIYVVRIVDVLCDWIAGRVLMLVSMATIVDKYMFMIVSTQNRDALLVLTMYICA